MTTPIWAGPYGYAVLSACVTECIRQKTMADRVPRLFDAYCAAQEHSRSKPLTLDLLYSWGKVIEPSNWSTPRVTPVSFQDGSTALSAHLLPAAMNRWIEYFNVVNSNPLNVPRGRTEQTGDEVDSCIKEFLTIHPLSDGNGRTAFVLYNWLRRTWFSPRKLPYYFGDA